MVTLEHWTLIWFQSGELGAVYGTLWIYWQPHQVEHFDWTAWLEHFTVLLARSLWALWLARKHASGCPGDGTKCLKLSTKFSAGKRPRLHGPNSISVHKACSL